MLQFSYSLFWFQKFSIQSILFFILSSSWLAIYALESPTKIRPVYHFYTFKLDLHQIQESLTNIEVSLIL